MKIKDYRSLRSITLPDNWVENNVTDSFPPRSIRSFSPAEQPKVKIEFYSYGLPISEQSSLAFRKVLSLAPRQFYNRQVASQPKSEDKPLLSGLWETLGNVGNNQIMNEQSASTQVSFLLNKLEVLNWNSKSIVKAQGQFQDPKQGTPVNYFCGIFVDATPQQSTCEIEQIYFEAPDQQLYDDYLPCFKGCLNSVQWAV